MFSSFIRRHQFNAFPLYTPSVAIRLCAIQFRALWSNFLCEISFRKLIGDQLTGSLSSCLIFLEDRQANSLWDVAKLPLSFEMLPGKALEVKKGFYSCSWLLCTVYSSVTIHCKSSIHQSFQLLLSASLGILSGHKEVLENVIFYADYGDVLHSFPPHSSSTQISKTIFWDSVVNFKVCNIAHLFMIAIC